MKEVIGGSNQRKESTNNSVMQSQITKSLTIKRLILDRKVRFICFFIKSF
jgi:hypothetical protein